VPNRHEPFIGRLYDAAWASSDRAVLAAEIARALDAPFASFLVWDRTGAEELALTGADPQLLKEYTDYYGGLDFIAASLKSAAPGVVKPLAWVNKDPSVCQTEYYQDFLRRMRTAHIAHLRTESKDGSVVTLGVSRSASQQPFDAEEQRTLGLLAPHLERAVRLQRDVWKAQREGTRVTSAMLDLVTDGVFLLDESGRIAHANGIATEILGAGTFLFSQASKLHLRPAVADRRFAALVAAVLGPLAERRPGLMRVQVAGERTATITVMPPPQAWEGQVRRVAAVVFVHEPKKVAALLLRDMFALTRQEGAIAEALSNGVPLPRVARDLGITVGTARFHLKRIFQKTNTHSQVELVTLLSTSLASVARLEAPPSR
jgi:DNA-binding CsgD family transcriptional regulator/PAS domain-containing protein